jgi:hypothetical protein
MDKGRDFFQQHISAIPLGQERVGAAATGVGNTDKLLSRPPVMRVPCPSEQHLKMETGYAFFPLSDRQSAASGRPHR